MEVGRGGGTSPREAPQLILFCPVVQVALTPLRTFFSCFNTQSSKIQGTAPGKRLWAWTCIYRSMPAGVVQSSHAFVGGTVSTWAR